MLISDAFTVELFYDLMTNGAADSLPCPADILPWILWFIRHEPRLETGSIHILCFFLANIMFFRGSLAVELFYDFADTRHCQFATSLIFFIKH